MVFTKDWKEKDKKSGLFFCRDPLFFFEISFLKSGPVHTCRSRKFHPARIRAMRQNQRIIQRDARIPSAAWEFCR
jgi:hypothetical protein